MLILAYVVHPTLPPPQLRGGGGISASPIFQPFRLQFNNTVAQLNIKQLSDTFYGSISTSKHFAVRINRFLFCSMLNSAHTTSFNKNITYENFLWWRDFRAQIFLYLTLRVPSGSINQSRKYLSNIFSLNYECCNNNFFCLFISLL